jgi:hypothetical protein
MLDRRSFLAVLGTSLTTAHLGLPGRASASRETPVFVAACMDPTEHGAASVAAFDSEGRRLFATRLPARGHDAVARPGSREVVVFARRPGNWAAVVDRHTGKVSRIVTTPPERHFFGHGAFSPDGRLLYATENRAGADDPGAGEGVLGIYDAAAGYARVGELPTHGLGPHDLALLPGSVGVSPMLVANGGTRTQPGTGREILNLDAMQPSLAVVDVATGDALLKVELEPELRGLSIRHLAVAADGEAVFACQWEGDPTDGPPLVGLLSRGGATRFLEMPDDELAGLNNYIGSVRLDAAERVVAATSPRGNTVAFWDRASGRYLGRRKMSDVCGIAPMPPAASNGTRQSDPAVAGLFVVSSGNAGVATIRPADDREIRRIGGTELGAYAWDNHILAL